VSAGTLFAVTFALAGSLAVNPLNASDLITTFGLIGVLTIIFAETGLLIGFFFPGDSLLFLAGIAASPFASVVLPGVNPLSIWGLAIGAPICAIAGAQLGHLLGARLGPRMFDKPNSRLFKPEYVQKAEHYFDKFGPARAVILARFIPIVRTFLNPVAGILEMPARRFFVYNVIGGILWTEAILLLGYGLAKRLSSVPNIDRYVIPAVVVIVLISAIPIFVELWRGRREHKRNVAAADDRHGRADDAAGQAPRPGVSAEGRHRASTID
jgi:membrane-associated protein